MELFRYSLANNENVFLKIWKPLLIAPYWRSFDLQIFMSFIVRDKVPLMVSYIHITAVASVSAFIYLLMYFCLFIQNYFYYPDNVVHFFLYLHHVPFSPYRVLYICASFKLGIILL